MDQYKKINWLKFFTREGFPYFILSLGLEGLIHDMKRKIGWGYRDQLFISKGNIETSYYSQRDAYSFEKFISSKKANYISKINKMIKNKFTNANKEIRKIKLALKKKNIPNFELIELLSLFYKKYRDLYSVYRFTVLVDAHAKDLGQKILSDCAKTKEMCGAFFSQADSTILKNLEEKIGRVLKIKKKRILFMNYQELVRSLQIEESVISNKDLEERFKFYILAAADSKIQLFTGSRAQKLFQRLNIEGDKKIISNEVRGQVAYIGKGKIKGKVRVVHTLNQIAKLRKNEILVTPMTTIKFIPFLKKAAAIITDEGGVTCHAAIVSRELGIPCVIGTKIATKVLKDGDLVEVDANKGVVKKIS